MRPAVDFAPSKTWVPFLVPVLAFAAGGILILLKRKIGLYLSVTGLSFYLVYYSYWQMVIWHFPTPFDSSSFILLAVMVEPLTMLIIGWKKVKW